MKQTEIASGLRKVPDGMAEPELASQAECSTVGKPSKGRWQPRRSMDPTLYEVYDVIQHHTIDFGF